MTRPLLKLSPSIVLGDDLRHAGRDFFSCLDVKELVRSMRIRLRTEHTRDEKLCLGELGAEHPHEGDGAADAHVHRLLAKEIP